MRVIEFKHLNMIILPLLKIRFIFISTHFSMQKHYILLAFLTTILLIGCSKDNEPGQPAQSPNDHCEQYAAERGFLFYENDHKMLYGGDNDDWHFAIDNLTLDMCRLHHGVGRESFKALIDPKYVPVSQEANIYQDNERTIVVHTGGATYAYPVSLVRIHEVINDEINGEPVAVVYCVLADFFRVYSRNVCDMVFTFALSGYTYNDPGIWDGRDGFVWWDRETESLWWPLIDKAVSGVMKGLELNVFPKGEWKEISWKDVLEDYPEAMVLKRNQTMEPPEDWIQYEGIPCGD